MAKDMFLKKVEMDIVVEGGVKGLSTKVEKELDLNQVMFTVVSLAVANRAESIIVPAHITVTRENVDFTCSVGTSKGFIDLCKQNNLNVVVKPNFNNKEENKMEENKTNQEVNKGAEEVAASTTEEKKTVNAWLDSAKDEFTNIVQRIMDKGFKIEANDTDTVLGNMEEALNKILKRAELSFAFESWLEPTKKDLNKFTEIVKQAKDNGWLETLKAVALWVCRKVFAIVKGVGLFTWDTIVFTLNTLWDYGKGMLKIAEKDILDTVKNA